MISPNSGALKFSSAPDYEAPLDNGANNEYNVSVFATDYSGNVSNAFAVTITVVNVDETPLMIVEIISLKY